ncbi:MAG: phosphoesterase [Pseudomonadota bacterium]
MAEETKMPLVAPTVPTTTQTPDMLVGATDDNTGVQRRDLLKGAAVLSTLAATACSDAPSFMIDPPVQAETPLTGMTFGEAPADRMASFVNLRTSNAQRQGGRFPADVQSNNGDESLYADFRGSFSKSLAHNEFGEVEMDSYNSFLTALNSRDPADFDAIIVGEPNNARRIPLVAPQAAFSFDQSALDGNGYRMDAAPAFASAETAAEMAELYWYALTRDVPLSQYTSDPTIAAAATELSSLSRSDIFPNDNGTVTPATIFRGTFPGAEVGPLVSQMLYQPFNFGLLEVEQRYDTPTPGTANQFMTNYDEWLNIQRGGNPAGSTQFRGSKRFIATMRDLGEFVHIDFPIQSPLYSLFILLGYGPDAIDPNIPYAAVADTAGATQQAFTSFGGGGLPHLVAQAPRIGLLGAWFQKWAAHRRLRPEAYAGRINNQLRGRRSYDINQEILDSEALDRIVMQAGMTSDDRALLPMGYPEGSPAHPAYPGGHSTFAAAGATICKAIFNEDFVIPNPVEPDASGSVLNPYTGPDLTIGGELNKLVGNITHGRDAMGMHWRSDGLGNFIGENVAITLLCDYSTTYNDTFDGFQLTRFNGERIRIVNGSILAA